jgi:hypothetical protein
MSEVVLGEGDFRYRLVSDWGELPEGWSLPDVAGIAVDPEDNVYVFNRGEHPLIVFDRHGKFLRSWGEGVFLNPHGIHLALDGCAYLTDDGDHTVRKFTWDGRLLLTIGTPKVASAYMSGQPLCRCTHTALSPDGSIYVADGYGNACIHKYDARGRHLFSWGRSGTDPGEFNIPHNIVCDAQGQVHVADRENHRVQSFDGDGRYLGQWNNLHRPCAMCSFEDRGQVLYAIGELGPAGRTNMMAPNVGPRISLVDAQGRRLARLGVQPIGEGEGQFIAPHGIAVDSRGDIYLGEVSYTYWPMIVAPLKPRQRFRTFRKLVRLRSAVTQG